MTIASAVIGFAVVAGLLTVVPGLDTALVLRAALTHGRAYAFATAFGVNSGALVWGAGAAAGVSALLTASALAYTGLRLVGAVYMVWLGARLLRSAVAGSHNAEQASSVPPTATQSGVGLWHGWRRGFLTNLLNPKIGAFYVAVLPQFLPPGVPPLGMGLLLALVHDVLGLVWFTALILAASTMRRALHRPAAQRAVDGATGTALMSFGIKLGVSSR